MPPDPAALRDRIREILLNDWDPSNASRFESARGEYDGYIPPLIDLLRSNPTEDAVIDFLQARERESMCFPACGRSHLRQVARKLLAVRTIPADQAS